VSSVCARRISQEHALILGGESGNKLGDMATYVYETIPTKAGQKPRRFEAVQKMSDPPLTKDPETGLKVRRVIVGGSGLVTHGASILSMKTRAKR
jgi:predicted nucleic acid-binding Zn ribbon protein